MNYNVFNKDTKFNLFKIESKWIKNINNVTIADIACLKVFEGQLNIITIIGRHKSIDIQLLENFTNYKNFLLETLQITRKRNFTNYKKINLVIGIVCFCNTDRLKTFDIQFPTFHLLRYILSHNCLFPSKGRRSRNRLAVAESCDMDMLS